MFTASQVRHPNLANQLVQKEYADKVIAMFDPEDKYFAHRLYREHCTFVDGIYIKDLGSLGRPLETTILVDNSIHAFACHITNGIPIPSFFGQPMDNELKLLVSDTEHSN